MLADPDEPLVLADGTKINPVDGKVIKTASERFIQVPSPSEAQKLIVKTRKTVADLPLPPQQLSGVALVAFYTLFGLHDKEISIAVDGRLTVEQVKQIRELEAYKDFMVNAKQNIIETETDTVRGLFSAAAHGAAKKIIEHAEGENDVLSFKASQDILDRAGHRPADIVEHHHKMDDALQIVITKRDETQSIPVIDIAPDKVTYDDSNI